MSLALAMSWMQAGAFVAAGGYLLTFRPLDRAAFFLGLSLTCTGLAQALLPVVDFRVVYFLFGVPSVLGFLLFFASFPQPARQRPILVGLIGFNFLCNAAYAVSVAIAGSSNAFQQATGVFRSETVSVGLDALVVITWLQGFPRRTDSQRAATWIGLAAVAVLVAGGGFQLILQAATTARDGMFLAGQDWLRQSVWLLAWVAYPMSLAALEWIRHGWRVPTYLYLVGCAAALPFLLRPDLGPDTVQLLRVWGRLLTPAFVLYAQARYAAFRGEPVGVAATTAVTTMSCIFAYGCTFVSVLVLAPREVALFVAPIASLVATAAMAAFVLPRARRFDLRRMLEATGARPLQPGVTVLGRYRIERILAEGSEARVYEASDRRRDGQKVALKAVPGESMRAESELLRRLDHPNIVRLQDIVEIPGFTLLVLDYAEGGNLRTLLSRTGRLPFQEAMMLAEGILAGLAEAHVKGVVHRDVKPENVLLDSKGTPMLADFGIARSRTSSTIGRHAVGTLEYLAPEQVRGEPGDARSDVYAAAVLIHEVLTGQRPTPDAGDEFLTRRAILTAVPRIQLKGRARSLAPLVRKALAKDPNKRHADAGEMRKDLRAALTGAGLAFEGFPVTAGAMPPTGVAST